MQTMLELLSQPWPWYVSGAMISLVMFLLLYFGKSFGVSDTMRVACSIGGGGRMCDFFAFDWRTQIWNLVFIAGAALGGFLAHTFLGGGAEVGVSAATIADLQAAGLTQASASETLPSEIFSWESLFTLRGAVVLVFGGFLVGFGARYAGGCTSGHAISGISDLQVPSMIAVVGFFIGGLIMTHLLLPVFLAL